MKQLDEGPRPVPCPRCGMEATWRFLDERKNLVEVVCPDCGAFEVPREEFDQAESEIVEPVERE